MTMPASCPNRPAPQARGAFYGNNIGGGCPGDSGTERPPMPMPSASYPSTGVGRFGTGVDRVRRCASTAMDFGLAGLQSRDFFLELLDSGDQLVDPGGDLRLAVARDDVLGAVGVPRLEREHDRALRPCPVGRGAQPLHQLRVALDDAGATPQLHALLGGEVQDEDVRPVVLLEMPERDVLAVAGVVGEGQRVRADRLQEARRPASMLDVGPAVGTGRG